MKVFALSTIAILVLFSCRNEMLNTIKISGEAQGTTYQITYLAGANANYRESFDSIFKRIDASLSTYVSSSLVSKINQNDTSVTADEHFFQVFQKAMEVSEQTKGIFDITVAPIVNAYGFGFSKREKVNQALIDSLLQNVGFKKVRIRDKKVVKESPQVMLDFNAIAQGYTVDVLASFLDSKGIKNYLVELGGELKAKGKRLDGKYWTAGIEQPNEADPNGTSLYGTLAIHDKSLATSGNYKRFYMEDGKKYAHIINPFTGYPAKNNLLSVTVVANDCMTADAYATAFMVMGLEASRQFLTDHPALNLDVLFIYDEAGIWKSYTSPTFQDHVEISY